MFIKVVLLAAWTAVVSAAVTTSTAETSYPVPSIINQYGKTLSPSYSVGSTLHTNFKVYDTLDFGYLNDWSNGYKLYREAGGLCSLSGRNIWFLGKTKVLNKATGKTVSTVDSSGTISTTFQHAWTLDFTANLTTGIFDPIPYTLAEQDANTKDSSKVSLYSHAHCVQISDTEAAHFWMKSHHVDLVSSKTDGNTLAYYKLDPATNKLNVRRDSSVFFPYTTYSYGSFANVVVNGIAYLYAIDTRHLNYDIHVAAVPVDKIKDIKSYTYYDASNGQWSSVQPLSDSRREKHAVVSYWLGFRSGSVFYSEYHNAYLMVFFSNLQDNKFRVFYSTTPVGPWKGPTTIYSSKTGALLNDHGLATPIYYDNTYDLLPSGKEILLTYTHTVFGDEKYVKAIKVKFA
ncbi:hypothetical protein V1511DRAFT_513781 [Dipodascopsis uninucleata]